MHHSAIIWKNQGMHIVLWAAFVTLAEGGSRADRQTQKEEMCEAMECVLTADYTTQDCVSHSGRSWWSDEHTH